VWVATESISQIEPLLDSARNLIEMAQDATHVLGEWSPTILLGHVSDVDEQVWLVRIQSMLAAYRGGADAPKLQWWEPDEIATLAKHEKSSLQFVANQLLFSRGKIARELQNSKLSEWEASANHATFGEISIYDVVKLILAHDMEHLAALEN